MIPSHRLLRTIIGLSLSLRKATMAANGVKVMPEGLLCMHILGPDHCQIAIQKPLNSVFVTVVGAHYCACEIASYFNNLSLESVYTHVS